MFKSARIKLTLYYLLIVSIILFIFSALVYRGFVFEFQRGLRARISFRGTTSQFENVPPPLGLILRPLEEAEPAEQGIFEEARRRILINIFFINGIILVATGAGAYFLAGETLKPIEAMVERQKRFVSDASHELRTPLTSLKTEIEVSLKDKKINMTAAKKLLKSNLEEVDKMQKLSNYLLSLNRYQDGYNKKALLKINLGRVVEKSLKKFGTLARDKEIKIISDVKNVSIQANEVSIYELVNILVDNAIKYSPKGSKIKVSVFDQKRHAHLEVRDWGAGIKKSELPYIFNRFYRADSSRNKQKTDGFGLGLAIAKEIVTSNRGSIKAQSTVGKGTTFTVSFPSV
jgi:two-component system sensor histidine kinase CiaH